MPSYVQLLIIFLSVGIAYATIMYGFSRSIAKYRSLICKYKILHRLEIKKNKELREITQKYRKEYYDYAICILERSLTIIEENRKKADSLEKSNEIGYMLSTQDKPFTPKDFEEWIGDSDVVMGMLEEATRSCFTFCKEAGDTYHIYAKPVKPNLLEVSAIALAALIEHYHPEEPN